MSVAKPREWRISLDNFGGADDGEVQGAVDIVLFDQLDDVFASGHECCVVMGFVDTKVQNCGEVKSTTVDNGEKFMIATRKVKH